MRPTRLIFFALLLPAPEFGFAHSSLDSGYRSAYQSTGLIDPTTNTTSAYDPIIEDMQALDLEKWEKTGLSVEKFDYGTITYGARNLEGVIARLKVNLKNRIVGEFKTYCRKVRAVYDDDFSIWRMIEFDTCESDDQNWKLKTSFSSNWLVSAEK